MTKQIRHKIKNKILYDSLDFILSHLIENFDFNKINQRTKLVNNQKKVAEIISFQKKLYRKENKNYLYLFIKNFSKVHYDYY